MLALPSYGHFACHYNDNNFGDDYENHNMIITRLLSDDLSACVRATLEHPNQLSDSITAQNCGQIVNYVGRSNDLNQIEPHQPDSSPNFILPRFQAGIAY